jgi:hypothetical protein
MPTSSRHSFFLVLGIMDKPGWASPHDVKVEAAGTVAPFWSVPHAQVYAQCDKPDRVPRSMGRSCPTRFASLNSVM